MVPTHLKMLSPSGKAEMPVSPPVWVAGEGRVRAPGVACAQGNPLCDTATPLHCVFTPWPLGTWGPQRG